VPNCTPPVWHRPNNKHSLDPKGLEVLGFGTSRNVYNMSRVATIEILISRLYNTIQLFFISVNICVRISYMFIRVKIFSSYSQVLTVAAIFFSD